MKLEYKPFWDVPGPQLHGDQCKRLDWEKAKKICEENPTSEIQAGLCEDWGYTHGVIFDNGEYKTNANCNDWDDSSFYGVSRWATPVLVVDNGEPIECWVLSDNWDPYIPENWGQEAKE